MNPMMDVNREDPGNDKGFTETSSAHLFFPYTVKKNMGLVIHRADDY